MIDGNSRYAGIELARLDGDDDVVFLKRRFVPTVSDEDAPESIDVTNVPRWRLDLIAAHALGDAFAFWRICDANDAMNPATLLDECGNRVRIPTGNQP